MEKAFLISSAALLVVYFIITETLDWVGRIEVIRDHFPRFPEFFERRTFRVALLLDFRSYCGLEWPRKRRQEDRNGAPKSYGPGGASARSEEERATTKPAGCYTAS